MLKTLIIAKTSANESQQQRCLAVYANQKVALQQMLFQRKCSTSMCYNAQQLLGDCSAVPEDLGGQVPEVTPPQNNFPGVRANET